MALKMVILLWWTRARWYWKWIQMCR